MQQGYADEDYSAVVKVMEGLAGIQLGEGNSSSAD